MKIIKNNMLQLLAIQLGIHKIARKRVELNRIWEVVVKDILNPPHIKDRFVLAVHIELTLSLILACGSFCLFFTEIYATLKIWAKLFRC